MSHFEMLIFCPAQRDAPLDGGAFSSRGEEMLVLFLYGFAAFVTTI